MATALKHESENSADATDRTLRLISPQIRQPKRLEQVLRFPIPAIELLPKPWRRSPWHTRGVFSAHDRGAERAFNAASFPTEEGETGHEQVWVAIDGRGYEIATARWGNWHEQQDEPTRQEIERKSTVLAELVAILDEFDPQPQGPTAVPEFDEGDSYPGDHYEAAAPEIRAMMNRGELLQPGVHHAPFLSPLGRPIMLTVDDQWKLVSAIEVLPYRVAIKAVEPGVYTPKNDPKRTSPFTIWMDAATKQFVRLQQGLQVAPWIPASGAEHVLLLGLDRHSRLITAYETNYRSVDPESRERAELEAQIREKVNDDDRVRIWPEDLKADPMMSAYDAVCDDVDDDMNGISRCADCNARFNNPEGKLKRCNECANSPKAGAASALDDEAD